MSLSSRRFLEHIDVDDERITCTRGTFHYADQHSWITD